MKLLPIVSVITIVYNSENLIEQTIKSVICQSYKNIEYIIVDGASSDRTMDIISKYRKNISMIISEKDSGISDAFNKGIRCSTGDYVMLLNSGDTLVSYDIISIMISELNDVDILTGFSLSSNGRIPVKIISNKEPLSHRARISHQASLVKREIYNEIGLYDLSYCIRMDYEFWLRCLKKYKYKFIDRIVVLYDIGGISSQGSFKYFYEGYIANIKNLCISDMIKSNVKLLYSYLRYIAVTVLKSLILSSI